MLSQTNIDAVRQCAYDAREALLSAGIASSDQARRQLRHYAAIRLATGRNLLATITGDDAVRADGPSGLMQSLARHVLADARAKRESFH